MRAAARVLVGGIGNIFLGDDAFGVVRTDVYAGQGGAFGLAEIDEPGNDGVDGGEFEVAARDA